MPDLEDLKVSTNEWRAVSQHPSEITHTSRYRLQRPSFLSNLAFRPWDIVRMTLIVLRNAKPYQSPVCTIGPLKDSNPGIFGFDGVLFWLSSSLPN